MGITPTPTPSPTVSPTPSNEATITTETVLRARYGVTRIVPGTKVTVVGRIGSEGEILYLHRSHRIPIGNTNLPK